MTVTLEREKENKFDSNAIQVVVHIKPISRKTVVGYVPKGLARELSKVLDMGIQVKASYWQRRTASSVCLSDTTKDRL